MQKTAKVGPFSAQINNPKVSALLSLYWEIAHTSQTGDVIIVDDGAEACFFCNIGKGSTVTLTDAQGYSFFDGRNRPVRSGDVQTIPSAH